jgi:integrase
MCALNGSTPTGGSSLSPRRSRYEGIVLRHARSCRSREGGRCSCDPSFQAQVWSARENKTIRKTFPALGDARAWRHESQTALRKGTLRSSSQTTLKQAAEDWLSAAGAGIVRTRTGEAYKPSAVRAYRQALNHRTLPLLGSKRLTAVSQTMLQDFAEQLSAQGLSASSVRNTILPLRAIFRRAHRRGEVAINPTLKLTLPVVRGERDRVAAPSEVGPLLDALQPAERAIYATALYAGLRLGELQALQWDDVDLNANLIHIKRNWDRQTGFVAPKSRSGNRRIPLTPTLRRELLNHRLQQGKGGRGFVFPNKRGNRPFNPGTLKLHTKQAWADAGLTPIGLHECRHTYAAYMIAAGINSKALSTYMGHSSITITLDRYGHLLPGNETEAAQLLDTWLKNAIANKPHRQLVIDSGGQVARPLRPDRRPESPLR